MSGYAHSVEGFTASFGRFSVELQTLLDEYAQAAAPGSCDGQAQALARVAPSAYIAGH